jgi:hypothetical protein
MIAKSICEMQVNSAYRGLARDDTGDFKTRVDQSLAKLKANGTAGKTMPSQPNNAVPKPGTPTAMPGAPKGAVNVLCNPIGANLAVDGEFVANAPASLKLLLGKHTP